MHTPLWQLSLCVHALPSSHAVPSGSAGVEHMPVAGSHVPATWHESSGAHTTGAPAVQTPIWQVSAMVQPLPSLHAVPLDLAGFEHRPVAGSHVPAPWHWSRAVQTTPVHSDMPAQTPLVHTSFFVSAFPSSHAVPFALAA